MRTKATDRCGNCGDEFANHVYIPNSITKYRCPHPHVESGYGFFPGGDPRTFHPDVESCSPEELAAHRRACELWNDCVSHGIEPTPEKCPSGFIYDDDGKMVGHVLRSPYGIGGYTVEFEQFFELADRDKE